MKAGTRDQGPVTRKSSQELREELRRRRAAAYYGGKAWTYQRPYETVKIGVIEAYQGAWMVGWVSESGGHHGVQIKALKHVKLIGDPEAVLQVLTEWAAKMGLPEVTP